MSADPRPLFYVTAVVFAALVVWVVSILARKGEPWARKPVPQPEPPPPERAPE